jgi:hypothetical protein
MSLLRVLVDGEALPTTDAIAFWKRFSAWMDEHHGDLGGFAASEGLASVTPEMQDGAPVIVASRSIPQRPYAPAAKRDAKSKQESKPQGSNEKHESKRRDGKARR